MPQSPANDSVKAHTLHRSPTLTLALAVTVTLVAGCEQDAPPAPVVAPPPSVIAMPARIEAVEDQAAFVGRIVAIDKVDLRARVQGFLKTPDFTEGHEVKGGDVLFVIEPDQYRPCLSSGRRIWPRPRRIS